MDPQIGMPASPAPTAAVTGPNVLWLLLTLGLYSFLHPFGATSFLSPAHRRYVRLLPLTALQDSITLLWECHQTPTTDPTGWRTHARWVIWRRFEDRLVELRAVRNKRLRDTLAELLALLLNIRIRLFVDVVAVCQFAKACGYRGIPWTFALATVYFAALVGVEAVPMVAYGIKVMSINDMRATANSMPRDAFQTFDRAQVQLRRKRQHWVFNTLLPLLQIALSAYIIRSRLIGPNSASLSQLRARIQSIEVSVTNAATPERVRDSLRCWANAWPAAAPKFVPLLTILFLFGVCLYAVSSASSFFFLRFCSFTAGYGIRRWELLGVLLALVGVAVHFTIFFDGEGTSKVDWVRELPF